MSTAQVVHNIDKCGHEADTQPMLILPIWYGANFFTFIQNRGGIEVHTSRHQGIDINREGKKITNNHRSQQVTIKSSPTSTANDRPKR